MRLLLNAKGESMHPYQKDVSSPRGAPMGRRSDPEVSLVGKVHLRCVPFVDGDYDQGGAYWGGGCGTMPLFCAWDDDGHIHYLRTASRDGAKYWLRSCNSGITFYR